LAAHVRNLARLMFVLDTNAVADFSGDAK